MHKKAKSQRVNPFFPFLISFSCHAWLHINKSATTRNRVYRKSGKSKSIGFCFYHFIDNKPSAKFNLEVEARDGFSSRRFHVVKGSRPHNSLTYNTVALDHLTTTFLQKLPWDSEKVPCIKWHQLLYELWGKEFYGGSCTLTLAFTLPPSTSLCGLSWNWSLATYLATTTFIHVEGIWYVHAVLSPTAAKQTLNYTGSGGLLKISALLISFTTYQSS